MYALVVGYRSPYVLNLSNSNIDLSSNNLLNDTIILQGTLTANVIVIVSNTIRTYKIVNLCTGAYYVYIKTAAGTGVYSALGDTLDVYCDGVNVVKMPVNAEELGGYSAGNKTGNVPLANGTKCVNLFAEMAAHLEQTNISTGSYTQMVTGGFSVYNVLGGSSYATGMPLDSTPAYYNCFVFGGKSLTSGWTTIIAYEVSTGTGYYINSITNGVWTGWKHVWDDDGNAVNANSLGGVAAANYALKTGVKPFICPLATPLQSGSVANYSSTTINYDGWAYIYLRASAPGVGEVYLYAGGTGTPSVPVFSAPLYVATGYGLRTIFPVKAGQRILVNVYPDTSFTSAYYEIHSSQY